jgi:coenzyme PQQ precursor peptide PqqA
MASRTDATPRYGAYVLVTAFEWPDSLVIVEGDNALRSETRLRREPMSWTAPVVVEICAGLEVTAYVSAEM